MSGVPAEYYGRHLRLKIEPLRCNCQPETLYRHTGGDIVVSAGKSSFRFQQGVRAAENRREYVELDSWQDSPEQEFVEKADAFPAVHHPSHESGCQPVYAYGLFRNSVDTEASVPFNDFAMNGVSAAIVKSYGAYT